MVEEPRLVVTPTVIQLPDHKATGAWCKQWRKDHKAKQCSVAEEMDIAPSMLSYLERGLKSWTVDTVTLFVRAVRTCKGGKA